MSTWQRPRYFYPRPPRGGRQASAARERAEKRISIHALREEGDHRVRYGIVADSISIHALREEGDPAPQLSRPTRQIFLSTPSARRATSGHKPVAGLPSISIHALREEGDAGGQLLCPATEKFLSTPSARRATNYATVAAEVVQFLSTPSARRATRLLRRRLLRR